MFQIEVPLKERSYRIVVGAGVSTTLEALRETVETSTRVFLLTNRTIWKIYSKRMGLRSSATSTALPLRIPDGEQFKNLKWYEQVCREMVQRGVDRRSTVIAFGGGVVGDLAGFVAATVLRGLTFVQIPTTLLSQIDSSIGGKTAVNLPEGKNLVGAFYQPTLVATDPELLQTLPPRELRSGLYEAIKYGVMVDRTLFEFIEGNLPTLLKCDLEAVETVIRHCASAKARIVGEDERETGLRKILNFGHTVGHALESATHYRRFKHGEAVGWGSLVALHVAETMSMISRSEGRRMRACIRAVGGLPPIDDLKPKEILSHAERDKKAVAGSLQFILPTAIGAGQSMSGIDSSLIRDSLIAVQRESRNRRSSARILS